MVIREYGTENKKHLVFFQGVQIEINLPEYKRIKLKSNPGKSKPSVEPAGLIHICKWFAVFPGSVPAFLLCAPAGPGTARGAAFGTTFLRFGNAFMFGGMLAALPGRERFDEFEQEVLSAKT